MTATLQLLQESEENLNWFQDNFVEIQEKYPNKIIAIKNKRIVASAANIEELIKLLHEKNIDDSEVLLEQIPPKNEIRIL